MADYLVPGIRIYLDRIVDWEGQLTLLRGPGVDVEAEVGAYRTLIETAASLSASFEAAAREHWLDEAELTEDGGAQPPAHMRAAYDKLRETGLVSLLVEEEYDGVGMPALVNIMCTELIARADASLMTVWALQTGIAQDVQKYGSEEVKKTFLPRFASGEVQGSMDLTEPQAGSDLGGILTRATELPDGGVRVDGQKIYITNGGAEVHLVLARDDDRFEESKGTTNGLSLLLVPWHLEDGSRNGVRVSRLEKKPGIHGSPTCEVVFEGARGIRLGEKGKGFKAMLDLMNASRLGVAAQALGLSQAAFHDALAYARQREQFGKPIIDQPLLKTMLAKMAVNIEAVRALLYRTIELVDTNRAREAAVARGEGTDAERSELALLSERDDARVRLLTPLCKYFATEICLDLTRDALQVFGGIGFTMDSNAAKLHTDSLITTIYEGTSEIQASFALKEMGKGALGIVLTQLRSELDAMRGDARCEALAKRVEETLTCVERSLGTLFADINYALLRAKLMAQMVINVIAGTELLRQVAADASRIDLAELFIDRRMIETEEMARRIEENAEGRLGRDERVLDSIPTA
jgi:alkylation response protein AidB-like acyl-CoA dehydrogenase